MFSIANLIERAKAGGKIETDYRLAKVLGISHQSMTGYRTKNTLPNEKVIEQLCALSGDDPDVIAAQIQAARAKSPEAQTLWLRVAARMSGMASTAFLSVVITIALIAGYSPGARAGEVDGAQNVKLNRLYIVSSTILTVAQIVSYCLLVRLRQITGLLRLCILAAW